MGRRARSLILAGLVVAATAACGDATDPGAPGTASTGRARGPESLDAVRKDFEAYVDTVNSCTADTDCTVIYPACPLGCFVAVPEARRKEIEAKAQAMLDSHFGGGPPCGYNCPANSPAACTDRRCTARPVPGPNPNR